MESDEEETFNILVAEDSQFQRLALCDLLEGLNCYNVFPASNGLQAKNFFTEKGGIDFDLVLLDYNMPGIDGLEVLMWMKSRKEYKDIPVIMMSTEEEVEKLYYCIEKGATDYLVKPIRSHNLRGLSKSIKRRDTKKNLATSNSTGEDYERIRLIGRGGSATVDLVQNKIDGEMYAMKIIPMFHYDEQKKKAAKNEITLLSILDSPFILRYHEHFFKKGNMYICMEYAEGGVVNDKIKAYKSDGKQIPETTMKNWMSQCVLALLYIHSKNVMHRDIKPENMFLTKDQKLKLGDFGVSREVDVNIDLAKTTCGTPYYMPPEVCNGQRYGHEADIWALGCSFYEIMTFELPFYSETLAGLFDVIKNEEPSRELPDTYDPSLRDLVLKMMSKNPVERPTILELLTTDFIDDRIREWCKNDPVIDDHVKEHTTLSKKKNKGRGKRKTISVNDPTLTPDSIEKNPEILVAELMKFLEPRTIKNGYFSKFHDAFESKDLQKAMKKSGCLDKLKSEANKIFNNFIDDGILTVLKGDDESFENGAIYTFPYLQKKNPANSIFEFDKEISEPVSFTCELMTIIDSVVETIRGIEKGEDLNILTCADFLLLKKKICQLRNCDARGLSKQDRSAFFLNIFQIMIAFSQLLEVSSTAQAGGGLLSYVGLGKGSDLSLQIGKNIYSIDDVLHGVLRGNQKKPGAWGKQLKGSDPRSNILSFNDKRIIPFYNLETKKLTGTHLIKFESNNLEKNLDALMKDWATKNVEYSNFQNELKVPHILEEYLIDFKDSEEELASFLAKFFTTKYLNADQLIEGVENGTIYISYDEGQDDEEENSEDSDEG